MPSPVDRGLNATVKAVFSVLGAVVRGVTAALAFALRRGRHRTWRQGTRREP